MPHASSLLKNLTLPFLCILLSIGDGCFAFEKGFYPSFKADSKATSIDKYVVTYPVDKDRAAIAETAGKADVTLQCLGLDDVHIVRAAQPQNVVHAKCADIGRVLSEEKKKDLIVVRFYKSIMWKGPAAVEADVSEFKRLLAPLEYRRILILGAHSMGVYVLYDSDAKLNVSIIEKADEDGYRRIVDGKTIFDKAPDLQTFVDAARGGEGAFGCPCSECQKKYGHGSGWSWSLPRQKYGWDEMGDFW